MEASRLTISRISLSDSGMYQCVAESEHGAVYASAELKVVGKPFVRPVLFRHGRDTLRVRWDVRNE